MIREEVYHGLAKTLTVADDARTIFCIQPFASVNRDNGQQLGTLLARVMSDPKNAMLILTADAFVFGFRNQLDANQDPVLAVPKAPLQQSSPA